MEQTSAGAPVRAIHELPLRGSSNSSKSALPTAEELLEQIKAERKAQRQRELAEWEKEVEQCERDGKKRSKPRQPSKLIELEGVTSDENLLLNQRIAYLRFFESVTPDFFLYYSPTRVFQNQFFSNETGNVGQGSISMSAVIDTVIPVPSHNEQTQIVNEIESRLSVVEQLEKTIEENLQKAKALRQSILKKAFRGSLDCDGYDGQDNAHHSTSQKSHSSQFNPNNRIPGFPWFSLEVHCP